jgi:DHA1 family tetracycline resistance protein-like MFS transporter
MHSSNQATERAPETVPPSAKASQRALWVIFFTIFLDLVGIGILVPVIPFLVRRFDSDALTVGWLFLSFAAAQFIAAPILGELSDRHGRRPVLLFSLVGSAIGYFVFGWAGSLWLMFLARILDGFTGGNISAAQAYIADISDPKDRAKNFGLIGAAFGVGFIIGPALGGILVKVSLSAPAYGAGLLALITVIFGYFMLPESLPPENRRGGPFRWQVLNPFSQGMLALRRQELWPLMLAFFLLNFAFSGLQSNFAVYTSDKLGMGAEANAMVFVYIGFITALMQALVVRRLTKAYSDRVLAMAGVVIMSAGFVCIASATSQAMIYLGCTLTPVGNGLTLPTLTSLFSKMVGPKEQGWVMGAAQSSASLARILGPLWAGMVYDYISFGAPYWTGALGMIVSLGVVFIAVRTEHKAR